MRKNITIILAVLLILAIGIIGFLLGQRHRQSEEFSKLQNEFIETKLELDRLKQVLDQE